MPKLNNIGKSHGVEISSQKVVPVDVREVDKVRFQTCIPHIVVRVGAAVFVKTYPVAMLTSNG